MTLASWPTFLAWDEFSRPWEAENNAESVDNETLTYELSWLWVQMLEADGDANSCES